MVYKVQPALPDQLVLAAQVLQDLKVKLAQLAQLERHLRLPVLQGQMARLAQQGHKANKAVQDCKATQDPQAQLA